MANNPFRIRNTYLGVDGQQNDTFNTESNKLWAEDTSQYNAKYDLSDNKYGSELKNTANIDQYSNQKHNEISPVSLASSTSNHHLEQLLCNERP